MAREEESKGEVYSTTKRSMFYHCGKPLKGQPDEQIREMRVTRNLFPPNFFEHPVHLHHNHNTGLTIGAVHCYCNAVLWEYNNE